MAQFLVSTALSAAFFTASYFLRPSQNVERGRISQIPIQQSSYGNMIIRFWGTARIGGNVIWGAELRQETQTESAKGIGGPSVTTFTYFTDLAVMLAHNRIKNIIRIWADGKLIYDITGLPVAEEAEGLTFRTYTGADDQEPDSLIQADIDGKFGVGSTPAYRGRAYVVFENLNLTNFGNRIPNFSFEVIGDEDDGSVSESSLDLIEGPDLALEGVSSPNIKTLDSARGTLLIGQLNSNVYTVEAISLDTMAQTNIQTGVGTEIRLRPVAGINYSERTGFLFGAGQGTTDFNNFGVKFHVLDFSTNLEISEEIVDRRRIEDGGAVASSSVGDAYVFLNNDSVPSRGIYIMDNNGQRILQQMTNNDLGDINVGESRGAGFHMRTPVVTTGPNGRHAYVLLADDVPPEYDQLIIYAVGVDSDDVGFSGTVVNDQSPIQTLPYVLKHGIRETLIPSDFGLTEFGPSDDVKEMALAYDRSSQALLVFVRDDAGNSKCGKWTRNGGIVDVIDVPFVPNDMAAAGSNILGDYAWTQSPTDGVIRVCLMNVSEFAIDSTINGSAATAELQAINYPNIAGFLQAEHAVWDSTRKSLYGIEGLTGGIPNNNTPFRITISTDNQAVAFPLSNILEDISEETGLERIGDIDVSEQVSINVPGFILANQQSGRSALQPLADLYFVDGVEIDYKLRYRNRGRSPSFTVIEDDMIEAGGDVGDYTQTRVQESEIPLSVQMTYFDKANEYQKATQQSARVIVPAKTVRSDNTQTIDVPVAEIADVVKQSAEKTLFTRWNEREAFQFKTGWEQLLVDPTDVGNAVLNNGRTLRLRDETADFGADMSIEFRMVQEAENQYLSTAVGQTGNSVQVDIVTPKPSELFLIDSPLLRDLDDPGAALPVMYWAASATSSIEFKGAVLHESEDLSNFTSIGATTIGASWGRIVNALPAPPSFWTWDNENVIDIVVESGIDNFVSSVDLAVLNGANALAVLRPTGEVEIVQFVDVTALSSTSVRLSRLLRGRRGTEVFGLTNHSIGSQVVLLETTAINKYQDTVAEINNVHAYKAVTVGRTLEATTAINKTPLGRSLEPYAPTQQKAVTNGNDIDLTAVRRTRINGELQDGIGTVPLNEESELYDLEILDAPGGTVLRTIPGLTTPFYKYLEADIITDFGTPPSSLDVVWYQISATVGRGFPGAATIEVQ